MGPGMAILELRVSCNILNKLSWTLNYLKWKASIVLFVHSVHFASDEQWLTAKLSTITEKTPFRTGNKHLQLLVFVAARN